MSNTAFANGYVTIRSGSGPLVLGMPHIGTMIPPDVSVQLNDLGRSVPDTDWWLDRLYGGIAERYDATVVMAGVSRFVIDVNRDPSGVTLYPGQNTTTLCPLATFDNAPIYRVGCEPGREEIERRKQLYFAPFHTAMTEAVRLARARHGYCVLYDCHSIRSVCPHLFEGKLPTLNLGTNANASIAPSLQIAATTVMLQAGYTHVSNGRFKGGWITRHYGDPAGGVHALQMEIAQSAYMMETPPWTYDHKKSVKLERALSKLIGAVLDAAKVLPPVGRATSDLD
jgi:N-formylglutamate deformylase